MKNKEKKIKKRSKLFAVNEDFIMESKVVYPFFLKEPTISKDLVPDEYERLNDIINLKHATRNLGITCHRSKYYVKAIDHDNFLIYCRSFTFRIFGSINLAFHLPMETKDVKVHNKVIYVLFDKGLLIYDLKRFRFYREKISEIQISAIGELLLLVKNKYIKIYSSNTLMLKQKLNHVCQTFTAYMGRVIFYKAENYKVFRCDLNTMETEEVFNNLNVYVHKLEVYRTKLFIYTRFKIFAIDLVDNTKQSIPISFGEKVVYGDVIRHQKGGAGFFLYDYNDLRLCGSAMFDECIKDFDTYEDSLFLVVGNKIKVIRNGEMREFSIDCTKGLNERDKCYIFKTDDFERISKRYYEFRESRGEYVESFIGSLVDEDFCEIMGIKNVKSCDTKKEVKINKLKRRKGGF